MASLLQRLFGDTTPDRQAVVASARQIPVNGNGRTRSGTRTSSWQESAFDMYDALGEVHNAFTMFGNGLSRARVFPAWKVEVDKPPVPITEAPDPIDGGPPRALVAAALDEWMRLDEQSDAGLANQGGVPGLVSEFATHLGLVGESVLYGRTHDDGTETFEAVSVSELRRKGDRWLVQRAPHGSGHEVGVDDYLLRIWKPHPRWSDLADSSLRPILDEGELLLLVQAGDTAIAKSRIGNAGLLYVDSDLDFQASDPTQDQQESTFISELIEEAIAPLVNPSSAASVVPLIVQGSGPIGDRIKHLTLDRPLDEHQLERAKWAVRRLALGIDLPPELILGKDDLNHWTAWQVDEASAKAHMEPMLQLICNALGAGWLRVALSGSFDANVLRRLTAWYDLSELLAQSNRQQNAVAAHERGVINDDALRRSLHFNESDAPPQLDQAVSTAMQLVRAAPSLIQQPGLPALVEQVRAVLEVGVDDDDEDVILPEAAPDNGDDTGTEGPPDAEMGVDVVDIRRAAVAALSAGADDSLDQLAVALSDADRTLMDRTDGAVDQALRRVLERAGAQLRSRARSDRSLTDALTSAPNTHVGAVLGDRIVRSLGVDPREMMEGEFDAFGERWMRWVQSSQERTVEMITSTVDVPEAAAATLTAEQSEDRRSAWDWFRDALIVLALRRLYAPDVETPDQGEFDADSPAPYGLSREAVARAGGAGSDIAGVVDDPRAGLTTRGIGTGPRAQQLLQAAGVAEVGVIWDYRPGISRQTFQPHARLHGRTFRGPDDPDLAHAGWPASQLRPGDHRGCRCMWRPLLTHADERR